MASFKYNAFFKGMRRLGVFVNLEVGLTRNLDASLAEGLSTKELEKAQNCLAEQPRRLKERERELTASSNVPPTINAVRGRRLTDGNITWILGTGRSGSTWLGSMMGDAENHVLWNEPLVGKLFGDFYFDLPASQRRRRTKDFIMGRPRSPWLRSIAFFVLEGAETRFPELSSQGHVIVKEPNGSVGAPLLTEAMPNSRVIFLIRDPRDVVASGLDANSVGSWRYEQLTSKGWGVAAAKNPEQFVRGRVDQYIQSISRSKEAYEAHRGPKTFIRYEDLRAEPLATLQRSYTELGMQIDDEELTRIVEKHSWENIPKEDKGKGKRRRKATPGSWQEDLTPEQIRIVEDKTAPLLNEFYPERMNL